MLRFMITAALLLPSFSHAASLKDYELTKTLEKVAQQSSQGTPRAINADILDQGYTVDGVQLINHLSVRASHALQMRSHPDTVRQQLQNSVCNNSGFRQLLQKGAVLRYEFSEYQTQEPVLSERFQADDCAP